MSDGLDERDVVTVFLRHDADVLLLCRSDEVGSYSDQWGGVAGHAEDGDWADGHPDGAAHREIREETGLDPDADVTLVRRGDPFAVEDRDLGVRWTVHPYLFDATTRTVETNYETTEIAWVPPPEILRRETVPDLWTSYDCVRPTAETVADDHEHGSAWISVRALETLRDGAALASERGGDWRDLATTARTLRDARPSMPVVANRVNRVMAAASDDRAPEAVASAAGDEIERALAVDAEAAKHAVERLPSRVATLSRSGTVFAALRAAGPETVLVAESRPGGEGVGVAERLANETDATVTLTTDAALAEQLATTGVEAVVVGADAVLPDGSVLNKVGTRAAATVAANEGVDCLVVAASDKVVPAPEGEGGQPRIDREERDAREVYDGDADVEVVNPTFDLTPADVVDAVVTEDGALDTDAVGEIAKRHRERARWDE